MPDSTSNNKRIAKNSLFLYLRMIVMMGVTLFTSRVILGSLGVDDYGIYNVVGGVATMFNILLGSMTDATQRFLTFEIGKGESGNINKVFSTSLLLHFILGIAIIIIAEPVGLWFINNKLIIPEERLFAAYWVFQCSLVSLFILIISIPYNALIVAHERMKAFAYISVLDALLRLVIAYLIYVDFGVDKLILYAILISLIQCVIRFVYNLYCKKHFDESEFHFVYDKKLIIEISKFASWTLFGNASYIFSNQGVSLLLGTFFAPYVNAARGIALQVQGALTTFVKNFQTAVNPQITKKYAENNLSEMNQLVFRSSRMSFLLLLIPLVPILFETDTILKLWLKNVPDYTIVFVRIIVVTILFTSLINPIEVSAKATGNIKRFEILVYGSKLLILPVSYILLKIGQGPIAVFVVALVFEIIALLLGLLEYIRFSNVPIISYFSDVLLRLIIVTTLSLILPLISIHLLQPGVCRMVIQVIISCLWTFLMSFIFGLSKMERRKIIELVLKRQKNDNYENH